MPAPAPAEVFSLVGTLLSTRINAGVPLHVVQSYLGHLSPENDHAHVGGRRSSRTRSTCNYPALTWSSPCPALRCSTWSPGLSLRKRLQRRRSAGHCISSVLAVGHELAVADLVTELKRSDLDRRPVRPRPRPRPRPGPPGGCCPVSWSACHSRSGICPSAAGVHTDQRRPMQRAQQVSSS
jgi:hypothetical protein